MTPDPLDKHANPADLQQLARAGFLPPEELEQALRLIGARPDAAAWARFLRALLLFLGSLLLVCGIIFFFAYNWADLHRLAKLLLVQFTLLIAVATAFYLGPGRLSGKAALLAAAVLVGALLALYGQTYQTGADAYELFLGWSLLITGWVIAGSYAPLWLLLLLLLETTYYLYWAQVVEASWFLHRALRPYEVLFGMNAAGLVLWELFSTRLAWLSGRWIPRIVGSCGILAITVPMTIIIFAREGLYPSLGNLLTPALYATGFVVTLWFYRARVPDLYLIAAYLLSAIVLIALFFGEKIGRHYSGFLLLALLIVGLSAGAAAWMRSILRSRSREVA